MPYARTRLATSARCRLLKLSHSLGWRLLYQHARSQVLSEGLMSSMKVDLMVELK